MPKVSFVIPAFRKNFVQRAAGSLLNQTMEDIEVLIFDNNQLGLQCEDKRVRIFYTPDYSPPRCYNEARELAKSDYLLLATDDDWWLHERALITYEYLSNGWDYVAGSCFIQKLSGELVYHPLPPFSIERQKYYANIISLPFIGYNKNVVPDFHEDFKICYDYLFHLDCGLKGLKMKTLPIPLGYKREWRDSLYMSFPKEGIRKEIDRIRIMYNDPKMRRRDFK